jgi:hypothetical protein
MAALTDKEITGFSAAQTRVKLSEMQSTQTYGRTPVTRMNLPKVLALSYCGKNKHE